MFVLSPVLVCVYTCLCTITHTSTHRGIHEHTTKQRYSSLIQVSHELFALNVFFYFIFKVFPKTKKRNIKKKKKGKESVLGTENSSMTASSPLLHRGQESVSINRKK